MSKKPYTPAGTLPPYEPPPGDAAALAKAKADTLAAEEAEADVYGAAQVGETKPAMPERFTSGGATAEEIAAWKAEHGC